MLEKIVPRPFQSFHWNFKAKSLNKKEEDNQMLCVRDFTFIQPIEKLVGNNELSDASFRKCFPLLLNANR